MLEDAQYQSQYKREKEFAEMVAKMEVEFFRFIDEQAHNLNQDSIF